MYPIHQIKVTLKSFEKSKYTWNRTNDLQVKTWCLQEKYLNIVCLAIISLCSLDNCMVKNCLITISILKNDFKFLLYVKKKGA